MIFVSLSPKSLQLPVWRDTLSNSVFKKRLALVAIDESPLHSGMVRFFCILYSIYICRNVALGGKIFGQHLIEWEE